MKSSEIEKIEVRSFESFEYEAERESGQEEDAGLTEHLPGTSLKVSAARD